MNEFNSFYENQRNEKLLRNKTIQEINSKASKRYENILSNFSVGLIIIGKENFKFEDKLEFINKYACRLFRIKENISLKELKDRFDEFVRLKNHNSTNSNQTLKDIIFSHSFFNYDLENFIPFESTYSKSIILYIKINEINNEKYIVIDKYNKYIEERKYIELNLIKTINYQYLHTLYHELNNPLNALLAIAGENEKTQIFSSDTSNSRIDNEPSFITKKKTVKLKKKNIHHHTTYNFKKIKNLISLNNDKQKINHDIFETKKNRRILVDNSDLNNKIPLLVNIIKIFIKNFILYLKTRADNLLMIKKEFDMQKETSDIMNVVEVSEYEKQLSRHKSVKINLEYIFNLYFEKFKCLFKYKEIEFETNFEKLKNIYVITDEFNFIYYIRQIYTYLYYIVPKKNGFSFQYIENEVNKTIKIIIIKKIDEISLKKHDENNESYNRDNKINMKQIIQTKEMTKEVLFYMSKRLNFLLDVYDLENTDLNYNNNIYLSITIPIVRKNKLEEDDDFKDEDISEMVQKDLILLEEKLKRQLPTCDTSEQRKSNNSTNEILELISKNDKDNSETSIYLQKKEKNLKMNSINYIFIR